MKRVLFICLIVACVFTGCSDGVEFNNDNSFVIAWKSDILYEEKDFYEEDWYETAGVYKGVAIPDKETAIQVATVIMRATGMPEEYIAQHVSLNTVDEIWIITFWSQSHDDTLWTGGCRSIGIKKSNGEVMRIWSGE